MRSSSVSPRRSPLPSNTFCDTPQNHVLSADRLPMEHISASPVSMSNSTVSLNPDELLSFGAKQIISLFVPVTTCMFFVVVVACTVEYYASTHQYLIYTPFHTPDADLGTRTWQTIANTLIFMSVIIVMTVFLVLLFKYQCYKCIHAWLVGTTFVTLFMISFLFFTQVFRALGLFVDYITMAFILWNFGVVGMVVIHWRGPLILQQIYLIFLSAQIALMFLKYLPKWTCWMLLGALAIWDLIAVLCPRGPLRMLVEMAHERNQPLFPALLYSTTAVYLMTQPVESTGEELTDSGDFDLATEGPLDSQHMDQNRIEEPDAPLDVATPLLSGVGQLRPDVREGQPMSSRDCQPADERSPCPMSAPYPGASTTTASRPDPAQSNLWRDVQADLRDREQRGVKLGLGDFVFYSLMIGRAALDGDSITVATTYVAILVGMCVTIMVLGITRRALPALPISIACGILFYFVTSVVISPFLDALACQRLFF